MTPRRWAIAGGGTGGHVTPALALGEAFTEAGDAVLFLGAERGLERKLVPDAGFELVTLPVAPFAGRRALGVVTALPALARATAGAARVLRRFDPALVVSVGGYAAVPAALAALARRTPLVLVEPNAVPGRANRALARHARTVFVGFDAAAEHFARRIGPERVRVVGVPLRRSLVESVATQAERRPPAVPLRLLVFGGSQGARQLNEAMLAALPLLDPAAFRVFHQTGAADRERVADGYARAGFDAEVVEFEPDLPRRYRWADLALCRAGALTVAELALAGLPSLLVPYPWAADRHQHANAAELARAGAARTLDPERLDGAVLAAALQELAREPARLACMGRNAAKRGRGDAARRIAEACRTLVEERK